MNAQLLVYIEKDIFDSIDNEAIMQYFHNMETCRPGPGAGQEGQLPRAPTCLRPIYNNIILILY